MIERVCPYCHKKWMSPGGHASIVLTDADTKPRRKETGSGAERKDSGVISLSQTRSQ